MEIEELNRLLQTGKNYLCLGHANLGSYSCFEIATEAIDDQGQGFCKEHAAYAKGELPNEMVCYRCREIVWGEDDVGTWGPADPDCTRCNGTGIDPVCRSNA